MVIYDLEKRAELCEENVREALDTHERHFYEDRLTYLINILKKY